MRTESNRDVLAVAAALFLALGVVVVFGAPLIVTGLLLIGWGTVCAVLIRRTLGDRERWSRRSDSEVLWFMYRVGRPSATRQEFRGYLKEQEEFWGRYGRFVWGFFLAVWFAFCVWIVALAL
ncbi:MAG TPA: hypothetical protein VKR79_10200 [Gaiellaceae bacterium]|nr:hypothetical protein [Gaiellaceae bacterium]